MEKRRLGNSNIYVTPIGLGCRTLGHRSETRREAVVLVQEAIDLGVNFVDTADIYRKGVSEEIIGEAMQSMRSKVILATKGGIVRTEEGLPTQDLRPESIRRSFEDSLKRLQTDYIDLYQIHYPDPSTPFSETVEALREFMKTGAIRNLGLSNFSYEELEEWDDLMETPSIQLPYNFFQKGTYEKLLPACRKRNIGMMVYTPLFMGLLTDKIEKGAVFGRGDERSIIPSSVRETCLNLVSRLKIIAQKYDRTVAQLVLNHTLTKPCVSCVLVGASSIAQVKENLGAVGWAISAGDLASIEDISKKLEVRLDDQSFTQAVVKVFKNYAGRQIAVLEMGMKLPVSSHVKSGDRIKISWNGEYLGPAEERPRQD